jgi:uncharacterized membrane protein YqjE
MDDLEDVVEALDDIEDIAEEVFEPDDLIEDLIEEPATVLVALLAGVAALFAVFLFLITVVLALLAFGPVTLLAVLTLLNVLVVGLAVGAFLYVRTSIPSDVRKKFRSAQKQADDRPHQDDSMSQEEAVDELKERYAAGEIEDHELDEALDDALTSDEPEKVVERYD